MSRTSRQQLRASLRNAVRQLGVAATLAAVVLAGCAADDADVDAVVENLEQELASTVVPALSEHGLTETTWASFHAAIQDVRTDELLVVAGPNTGGASRSGEPDRLESVVTIVGPRRGACIAVSVSADGTVKSVPVIGDPATNCEGAQLPDASL